MVCGTVELSDPTWGPSRPTSDRRLRYRRKFPASARFSYGTLTRRRNEFTTEGGKLHGAVAESMQETGMLEKSAKVVAAARAKGITVIHPHPSAGARTHPGPSD